MSIIVWPNTSHIRVQITVINLMMGRANNVYHATLALKAHQAINLKNHHAISLKKNSVAVFCKKIEKIFSIKLLKRLAPYT